MDIEKIELTLSRAKISREDLAILTGMSRPTVVKILNGAPVRGGRLAAFKAAIKLIEVAESCGTLPVPRRRAGDENRRQVLTEALAAGARKSKAPKPPAPEAEDDDTGPLDDHA